MKMEEKRKRLCTIFNCDRRRGNYCCADCWRRTRRKCRNVCQNDPSRCGLEDRKERPC